MKILVTDGDTRAALAIVRSLGKKGHQIYVGNYKQPSLASSSKYCKHEFVYNNPKEEPSKFIEDIINTIKINQIDVVLPVTDITTISISEHKEVIEKYCKVPFADAKTLKGAANKFELFKVAHQLNIPIPESFYLETASDVDSIIDKLKYPIVIKPYKSRIKTETGWQSTTVSYANSQEELLSYIKIKNSNLFPLLLQERINGAGLGVFVLIHNSKLIAYFGHQRIREKPPSGGVSTYRQSVALSPSIKKHTETLLKYLNWQGVAMVEYKMDKRDNIPKLMEINGRFWGSLQLALDAGVDFPALLLKTLDNKPFDPIEDYKIGVKTRWFMGDLDSLLLVLFKDKKVLNVPKNFSSKTKYFFDFLKIWQKNQFYEVESFKDIRPWIYEWGSWLKN